MIHVAALSDVESHHHLGKTKKKMYGIHVCVINHGLVHGHTELMLTTKNSHIHQDGSYHEREWPFEPCILDENIMGFPEAEMAVNEDLMVNKITILDFSSYLGTHTNTHKMHIPLRGMYTHTTHAHTHMHTLHTQMHTNTHIH